PDEHGYNSGVEDLGLLNGSGGIIGLTCPVDSATFEHQVEAVFVLSQDFQSAFRHGWQVWNVLVERYFAWQFTFGVAATSLLQGCCNLCQTKDLIGFDLTVGEGFRVRFGIDVVSVGMDIGFRAVGCSVD